MIILFVDSQPNAYCDRGNDWLVGIREGSLGFGKPVGDMDRVWKNAYRWSVLLSFFSANMNICFICMCSMPHGKSNAEILWPVLNLFILLHQDPELEKLHAARIAAMQVSLTQRNR